MSSKKKLKYIESVYLDNILVCINKSHTTFIAIIIVHSTIVKLDQFFS